MINQDCRCPGCGTCGAADEVERLRKTMARYKRKQDDISPWQRACDEAREAPTSGPIQDGPAVAIEAAERLLAYARSINGDECTSCQGYGRKTYPTTATWRGGAGGMTITTGVCDKCWGSGLSSRKGLDLRKIASLDAENEKLREERDELKTRLAHAEADAEQAVHNEAFNERMKIVAWMRNRVVHKTNASMQTLDELVSICDAIHRGEHE